VLYSTELQGVVAKHGVTLHQYADDCQVYASMPMRDVPLAIDRLSRCMADVSDWLDGSHLRLNPGKTEVMWLARSSASTVCDISILSVSIGVSDSARILGVVVDSRLTMADHVSSLCRSIYYQLRQL